MIDHNWLFESPLESLLLQIPFLTEFLSSKAQRILRLVGSSEWFKNENDSQSVFVGLSIND